VKESVKDFAEVHTWIWQHCFDKLKQVYEKAGVDKAKVKNIQRQASPREAHGGPGDR